MGAYFRFLKSEFIFLFGAIWAAVGTPFMGVAAWQVHQDRRIALHGVAGEAELVEKLRSSSKDSESNYRLKYVFQDAAGREHIRTAKVSWEIWRQYEEGAKLPIVYLPGDASKSRLGGALKESGLLLALLFGGLGLVFGGVGWYLVVKAVRRASRSIGLMRNGMPTQGKVKDVLWDQNVNINGRHPAYLSFTFTGPAGQVYEGESRYLPRAKESAWQAGDSVTVIYDPMDPSRFEVDIMGERDPLARR